MLPTSVKNHRSSPPSRLEAHTRVSSAVPFTTSLQHPGRQIPIRSVLHQITTGFNHIGARSHDGGATTHHSQRTSHYENHWSALELNFHENGQAKVENEDEGVAKVADQYIDFDGHNSNLSLPSCHKRGDITRQRAKDDIYKNSYNKWLNEMSPEERLALKRLGLDRPSIFYAVSGRPGGDIAESSKARQETDIAAQINGEVNEAESSAGARTLCRLMNYLLSQSNMELMLDAFAFELNLGACDKKAKRSICKRYRISNETFERYRKNARREFDLQSLQGDGCVNDPDSCAFTQAPKDCESKKLPTHGTVEVLRKMIVRLQRYRNIQLTLDCLALVLNLSVYTGESMAGIGRRLKISREAVSKHCKKISKDFNIPLSRAMRSQTSVACAKREICWKSRS